MRLALPVAVGLALLVAACQAPPPTSPVRSAPARDPANEARVAFMRGDWAVAAPLFREAIGQQPGSIPLHYGLAVCVSHLDALDEAANEFRWVVEHAAPGSEEAKVARAWLAAMNARPTVAAESSSTADPSTGDGSISGFITGTEPGQALRGRERQLVLLQGIRGTATAGLLYRTRTDDRGYYELTRIVPGPYKVTDAIAGQATWRLKTVVEQGRTTVLDLTSDNRLSVRDDFPEDRAK